jgi:hypothetical protein
MKSITRSLLIILLFSFSGNLISQDAAMEMDRVYGLDPLLYNGKIYTYFLPAGTGGNQFLYSAEFIKGDVVIKGVRFLDILLNYDIFNQQLLLQYTGETGAINIIEISKAWLESFRLGKSEFRYLSFEKSPRIYQVLGDGPLFILYAWRKDLKLDVTNGAHNFIFTPAVKNKYVLIGDNLLTFRGKRSLVSVIGPEYKTEIRNYIHVHRIKMKHASDETMTELINYIGNL